MTEAVQTTEATNSLFAEIVDTVLKAVNMQSMDRSTITSETTLVDDGLGLDSVEILEVVVSIEQVFKVKIKDAAAARDHFQNFGTIEKFIQDSRA